MLPALRPSRPFWIGPILFCAPGPIPWQGEHFTNDFWPAATSCAGAIPVHPIAIATAIGQLVIDNDCLRITAPLSSILVLLNRLHALTGAQAITT